jgi:hypothetical protein
MEQPGCLHVNMDLFKVRRVLIRMHKSFKFLVRAAHTWFGIQRIKAAYGAGEAGDMEQAGCLHANMDLCKVRPRKWLLSELDFAISGGKRTAKGRSPGTTLDF